MSDGAVTARAIVGLEVHVQLATRTKLFCGCAVEFAAPPNVRVCPVCLGLPGVLPVMNRRALALAVRAGRVLNCSIASVSRWDRKSYYYPDLPKNYQISQYDLPLCRDGYIDIPGAGGRRRIRIIRAHLEEDAGKSIHDRPDCTLVDLNRAGTPLLEVVTQPDLVSADEAHTFAVELQRLMTYLEVSEGNMQRGQMRFEPNVNVAITGDGVEHRTPISEIKNLNSFRALRAAIDHEVSRQVGEWRADSTYVQEQRPKENRGWNEQRGVTELQRSKEEAPDYRYFPEPDLMPVEVAGIEDVAAELGGPTIELPLARQTRFEREMGLAAEDAAMITRQRATADLFEAAVRGGAPPGLLSKQFVNVYAKLAKARGVLVCELGLVPERVGRLAGMVVEGTVSPSAGNRIAEAMVDSKASPEDLADELDLAQVQDAGRLATWVDQALSANPEAVRTILTNPRKARASEGYLRGEVLRISGGRADPRRAGEIIVQRIDELRGASNG